MGKSNIPRVKGDVGKQKFFDNVKNIIDVLTGKIKNSQYDRALTVRDLERIGYDMDKFLASDKKNPYLL